MFIRCGALLLSVLCCSLSAAFHTLHPILQRSTTRGDRERHLGIPFLESQEREWSDIGWSGGVILVSSFILFRP